MQRNKGVHDLDRLAVAVAVSAVSAVPTVRNVVRYSMSAWRDPVVILQVIVLIDKTGCDVMLFLSQLGQKVYQDFL